MFEQLADKVRQAKEIVFVTGPGFHRRVEFLPFEERTACGENTMP